MKNAILIKKGSSGFVGQASNSSASSEKKDMNRRKRYSCHAPNAGYARRPRANAANWI